MLERITRLALRAAIAAAVLWAVVSVPLPLRASDLIVLLRVPIAVFIFIIYVGKSLYDTFFFERQG